MTLYNCESYKKVVKRKVIEFCNKEIILCCGQKSLSFATTNNQINTSYVMRYEFLMKLISPYHPISLTFYFRKQQTRDLCL